jgi:hypothetical protein
MKFHQRLYPGDVGTGVLLAVSCIAQVAAAEFANFLPLVFGTVQTGSQAIWRSTRCLLPGYCMGK